MTDFIEKKADSIRNAECRIIGTDELGKIINYSPVHIRRLARQKKLPAPVRIGGRKLGWRLTDIAALIGGHFTTAE